MAAEAEGVVHWSEPDLNEGGEDGEFGAKRTLRAPKKKKLVSVNKMAGTGKTKMRFGSKR